MCHDGDVTVLDATTATANDAGVVLAVEIVTSHAGLLALGPEYDRLLRLTRIGLPFALHEWHSAWCRHFLRVGSRVKASPMIFVAREADGTCVGIVPMIMTERLIGPVKCRALDLIGPDPAITEIRVPLLAPGRERAVARAVQHALAVDRRWDWVQWSGLSGAFAEELAATSELQWNQPIVDHVIDLPSSWAELRSRLKRNIRESLRHGYNSLKREGFDFEFRVVEQADQIPAALERFFALHAARARQETGVAHSDHFSARPARRFLVDVCIQLAQCRIARVFELVIGETVVATRVGFVVRDSLYLYYSGFDPAWARFGVMTTTTAEAIKYAILSGLASVNLSPGTDVSKTRWSPYQTEFGSAVQVARTLKSRLAFELYQRARARKNLPRWLGARIARRIWD